MAKRGKPFKSEKRRKEVQRQKKQEEKRLKRQKKDVSPSNGPGESLEPVSDPGQADETSG